MTEKDITPMGGFPHYGVVNEDYVVVKVGRREAVLPLLWDAGCC